MSRIWLFIFSTLLSVSCHADALLCKDIFNFSSPLRDEAEVYREFETPRRVTLETFLRRIRELKLPYMGRFLFRWWVATHPEEFFPSDPLHVYAKDGLTEWSQIFPKTKWMSYEELQEAIQERQFTSLLEARAWAEVTPRVPTLTTTNLRRLYPGKFTTMTDLFGVPIYRGGRK